MAVLSKPHSAQCAPNFAHGTRRLMKTTGLVGMQMHSVSTMQAGGGMHSHFTAVGLLYFKSRQCSRG